MTITYHTDLIQGSDEWYAERCGLLTASEMKLIIAPPPEPETRIKKNGEPYKQREWNPLKDDDKCRAHLFELLAQRITKYVEPQYISNDMLRGKDDEIEARTLYHEKFAPVEEVGFVTNDRWGFTIGYSPDGLVGKDGQVEFKSRRQKFQAETVIEFVSKGTAPTDFLFQLQSGLLVTERQWCDFGSYSGGMPMVVVRVYPDDEIQHAIVMAASAFEKRLAEKWEIYRETLSSGGRFIPTERRIELEIFA